MLRGGFAAPKEGRRRRRRSRRSAWLRVHRWLGLSVGVLLALSGVTGSLLVFDHAIDAWLYPDMLRVEAGGGIASLDRLLTLAASTGHEPRLIALPREPGSAVIVEAVTRPRGEEPQGLEIALAPDGSRVLGVRGADTHLMAIVYRLHHTLLAGRNGEIVMGFAGLGALVSLASGLYLWWPGRRRLAAALTIKRGTAAIRQLFDLHRSSGFYASLVLAVIIFTGVYLVFPDTVRGAVGTVARLTPPPVPADAVSGPPGAEPLAVDEIAAVARAQFPDGDIRFIRLPTEPGGSFAVAVRLPGEVRRSGALSGVLVDPYQGRVLARVDSREMTAGDTFLAWQFPLHNGEAFGLPGRLLVFGVGWLPLLLLLSGAMIWWHRGRARASRRRQSAA